MAGVHLTCAQNSKEVNEAAVEVTMKRMVGMESGNSSAEGVNARRGRSCKALVHSKNFSFSSETNV